MSPLDVLLLFPGSLFGETWADGPRVKPELVGMLTYLRRHDLAAGVLDLEVELGGNPAAGRQEAYLAKAEKLLLRRPSLSSAAGRACSTAPPWPWPSASVACTPRRSSPSAATT
jgi:hypothetical protein